MGADRGTAGSGHHLIRDGSGTPLRVATTDGNVSGITQALALADGVPSVAGRPGRPRKRPESLLGDKGDDSRHVRRELTRRRVLPVIARRAEPSRARDPRPRQGPLRHRADPRPAPPVHSASAVTGKFHRVATPGTAPRRVVGPRKYVQYEPRPSALRCTTPDDATRQTFPATALATRRERRLGLHVSLVSHSHAPSPAGEGSTSRHRDRVTSSEPRSTDRGSGRRPADRPGVGPPACRPACTPVPCIGGTPSTTAGSPEPRPGTGARTRAASLVGGAHRSLASDVNFGHASRARWNEQANTAPRAAAKPMGHLHSRCASSTSVMSVSKDSGNHRPSIGRDPPCIA
ncbi:transposase [Streptomyces kutzneri]|uniref:transposase n=1 Tax=Streptomyces kutzneri TaxID=3051179 RepID=UPI0034D96438